LGSISVRRARKKGLGRPILLTSEEEKKLSKVIGTRKGWR